MGTLYQYFPNKSALLQAALRRHLESIAVRVERACHDARGSSLAQMTTKVANVFLEAKTKDLKTSIALYSVSSDVDGWKIAREMGARMSKAIVAMMKTAPEPLPIDPQPIASIILATMTGVSRALLETLVA